MKRTFMHKQPKNECKGFCAETEKHKVSKTIDSMICMLIHSRIAEIYFMP